MLKVSARQLGVLQVDASTVASIACGLGVVEITHLSDKVAHLGVEVKVERGGAGDQAVLPRRHAEHVQEAPAEPDIVCGVTARTRMVKPSPGLLWIPPILTGHRHQDVVISIRL